jgi:hypothetical protein
VSKPNDYALRGRIGAYVAHARHGGDMAVKARTAWRAKFETQVDPDGLLPPEERRLRAEAAMKAEMARLAYRSAVARRRRSNPVRPDQTSA